MPDLLGRTVRPMLARTAARVFDSPRHLFEVKWDGYRCLALIAGGILRLQSRNLRDLTALYPELAPLPGWIKARQAILDGELVAFRDGLPDFQALQDRHASAVYVVFDLLHLDGRDLLGQPLRDRRATLRGLLQGEGAAVVFSDHVEGQGRAFFRAVTARGLEGVMAKEASSPYLPGQRSRYWLKVRHVKTVAATIVGYTGGARGAPASLVLGTFHCGVLRYLGRVGTGYSEEEGASLLTRLRPRADPPLADPERVGASVRWVEPTHRCRVEYLELTADGLLRHPVYRGLEDGG